MLLSAYYCLFNLAPISNEELGHIHHLGRRVASSDLFVVLQFGVVAVPFVDMARIESPLRRVGQTVLFVLGLVNLVERLLRPVSSGGPEQVEQVVDPH